MHDIALYQALVLPPGWEMTGWRAKAEPRYNYYDPQPDITVEVEVQLTYWPTGLHVELLVRQTPGPWLAPMLIAMQELPADAEVRAVTARVWLTR